MQKTQVLIYGSYGYTGHLIVERVLAEGVKPLLSGRNAEKLQEQAQQTGLNWHVVDVNDEQALLKTLENVNVIINCAGPFIETYLPIVQACLKTKTHYIDITGEVAVFEGLMKYNEAAKQAGIMLLPGAGFDVVPSDCLAQHVKSLLPDASGLTIAIANIDKAKSKTMISRGTAKSMLNGLTQKTLIREQGQLKKSKLIVRDFNFDGVLRTCALISWGDVATAWWSTGIPHIETYMAMPLKAIRAGKYLSFIYPLLKIPFVKNYLKRRIDKQPEGPTIEERNNSTGLVFAEVVNPAGKIANALLQTCNGYELTGISAALILKKILTGNIHVGYQTPSSAYGKDLILEIPGSKILKTYVSP